MIHEQMVEAHPDFIPGLNSLAYMYADRYPSAENLDRGRELLAKIPDEEKRTPTYWIRRDGWSISAEIIAKPLRY